MCESSKPSRGLRCRVCRSRRTSSCPSNDCRDMCCCSRHVASPSWFCRCAAREAALTLAFMATSRLSTTTTNVRRDGLQDLSKNTPPKHVDHKPGLQVRPRFEASEFAWSRIWRTSLSFCLRFCPRHWICYARWPITSMRRSASSRTCRRSCRSSRHSLAHRYVAMDCVHAHPLTHPAALTPLLSHAEPRDPRALLCQRGRPDGTRQEEGRTQANPLHALQRCVSSCFSLSLSLSLSLARIADRHLSCSCVDTLIFMQENNALLATLNLFNLYVSCTALVRSLRVLLPNRNECHA